MRALVVGDVLRRLVGRTVVQDCESELQAARMPLQHDLSTPAVTGSAPHPAQPFPDCTLDSTSTFPELDPRVHKHPLETDISGSTPRSTLFDPALPSLDARLHKHPLDMNISGSTTHPTQPFPNYTLDSTWNHRIVHTWV